MPFSDLYGFYKNSSRSIDAISICLTKVEDLNVSTRRGLWIPLGQRPVPSVDRAGRHDLNPFRSGHAVVKRQMESGFDLDELASAIEEVDHVSVWPESDDRTLGHPYRREHFRIVEQGRIRGLHSKSHVCSVL